MKAILSADLNWGIGCDNHLLARVPEDMKRFKSKTLGKVVIMGRKTFESLPNMQPLTNRINIVLTKNKNFENDGVIILHSTGEALKEAQKYEPEDVFVIGGEKIYRKFLPYCDEVFVTKFMKEFEADAFFPDLDGDENWELAEESEEKVQDGLRYKFTLYKNKAVEVFE